MILLNLLRENPARRLTARLSFGLALLLCLLPAAGAQQGRHTLHTIQQIFDLPKAEAEKGYPIQLDALVTYSDPEWGQLFIQDETGATFIFAGGYSAVFPIGARIQVRAVTSLNANGIAISHPSIQVVGSGHIPAPLAQTVAQIDEGSSESHFVTTEGVLHPCTDGAPRFCFRLYDGTKSVTINVRQADPQAAHGLTGAKARVRGVVHRRVDGWNHRLGMGMYVESLKEIEVESPPLGDSAPPAQIADLLSASIDQRFTRQARVRGVVTWTSPRLVSLQDATGTIFLGSEENLNLHSGDRVEAIGFPSNGEFGMELSDSLVALLPAASSAVAVTPLELSAAALMNGSYNGRRVRLRARLMAQSEASQAYVYQFRAGPQSFSALLLHGPAAPAMLRLPAGSTLELTGVAVIQRGSQRQPGSLLILVESPADIVVQPGFGWLTVRVSLGILAVMALCVLLPLIWVRQLRFKVRQQTAILRTQFENELQLENRFRRLFEHNLAAVYFWKPDGTIVECNQAFVKLLGLESREQVIGRSYWELESDTEQRARLRNSLQSETPGNYEATLHRDDGAALHLLTNITPVHIPEGVVYETTAIDVTQLHLHQDELQSARDAAVHESLRDPLTGLPNRRHLMEKLLAQLDQASRESSMMALLYLDLDGFKLVNDSLGHGTGDALLVQVAHCLRRLIPEGDMLARIGGDEFMVIMNRISSYEPAASLARDLLEAVSQPFQVHGHTLSIGVSIGISLYPSDASDGEELMQRADGAMYAAKRAGKNSFMHFNAEVASKVHEQMVLENQLRGAVARHEIEIHYQPEFDLGDDRLIRFEALARWTHPALGAIPPAKFIPIAEENGSIAALGAFIMEQACRDAVCWQQYVSRPIQVAVNVSNIQFRNPLFVEEVSDILARTGLSPQLLQIEVTESVMLDGAQDSYATLNRLRALGISMAIDDFGTGYSNLSYLPSLAFDLLKIDRCFVTNMETQPESESMIRTLIQLAHNFGMRTVVEGVETAEQLAMIKECGADEVQGFLMGRPAPNPIDLFLRPMGGEDSFPEEETPASLGLVGVLSEPED
jgi:diguanylate cyclase (GGDEF)-like protein/PAS domain S-box-containing protein